MPEHVMLRDKKKYASADELKRWENFPKNFPKQKKAFEGGEIGICRMATTTHPTRGLLTVMGMMQRQRRKVDQGITGEKELDLQEDLHMALALLRMVGQSGERV